MSNIENTVAGELKKSELFKRIQNSPDSRNRRDDDDSTTKAFRIDKVK